MLNNRIALSILLLLAAAGWAQEPSTTPDPAPESEGEAEVTEAAEPPDDEADEQEGDVIEDIDLDSQTYEEDDDDFVPTEEIPADEPIPFPSNI